MISRRLSQMRAKSLSIKLQHTAPKAFLLLSRPFATQNELLMKKEQSRSKEQNQSELAVETEGRSLKFIEKNPLLKQVFFRQPNDNYYPEIKAPSNYWTLSELQELQKEDQASHGGHLAHGQSYEAVVTQIIDSLEERLTQTDPVSGEKITLEQLQNFTQVVASNIYDTNIELLVRLYDKVIDLQSEKGLCLMSEKFFNYVAWGAAHFKEHDLLSKVLYQAAILDYQIDLQTYLKCQLSISYQDANPIPLSKNKNKKTNDSKIIKDKDQAVDLDHAQEIQEQEAPVLTQMERSQYRIYYYLLLNNDIDSYDDFQFVTGMLNEYMNLNLNELRRQQELNNKSKSQSSKKKKTRRYNARNAYQYDVINTLDHSKYDPLDEQFFQKNKIYNSYLKQAGQKLKDANMRLRFGKNDLNPLKAKSNPDEQAPNVFNQSWNHLATHMHTFPLQQDLVAHQTSRHIDKYSKHQPRFNIEDDEKQYEEGNSYHEQEDDILNISNEPIFNVYMSDGKLIIELTDSIFSKFNETDRNELAKYYATLLENFISEAGTQAQYCLENFEAPTFLAANQKGFNLMDHYHRKKEEHERASYSFENHRQQEENRIKMMRQKQLQEEKNWQDQVINNLIDKDRELRQSNDDLRSNLDSNKNDHDTSERLNAQNTGYETTEFTTDGTLHLRSQGKQQKYRVDFKREHSEEAAEVEHLGRQFGRTESEPLHSGHEDHENLYTTEMEEGEENDLKARKSIIRSELKDGSINEESQQPLSYHINVGPVGHTYSFYTMKNIVDDVNKSQQAQHQAKANQSSNSSSEKEQIAGHNQLSDAELAEEFSDGKQDDNDKNK